VLDLVEVGEQRIVRTDDDVLGREFADRRTQASHTSERRARDVTAP
jgi:hypothetical protein